MRHAKRRASAYRVYVRTLDGAAEGAIGYAGAGTVDGNILRWTETLTPDPDIADEAIQDLLATDCFQDNPFVLIAQYRGSVYFTHEFSALEDGSQVVPTLLARLGRIDWLRYPSVH
jgi:hypothetical protein